MTPFPAATFTEPLALIDSNLGAPLLDSGLIALQSASCPTPGGLEPFFEFMNNITLTVVLIGVGLGILALSVSGIQYMWGGIQTKERAKERVQRVILGLIILLSAQFVVAYLVTQLPVCST